MTQPGTGLVNIPTDTTYLGIHNQPLSQAAVEQLERAYAGKDLSAANWIARVVISHGVGDQRFSHEVAIGQLKVNRDNYNAALGQTNIAVTLVALRINPDMPAELYEQLRNLSLGLLMF
jgi:hypothetical protein